MMIHGRLQWSLAAGMVFFSAAALVASFFGGDSGDTSVAVSTTTSVVVATTTTTTSIVPTSYTVQYGESIFSIAQKFGLDMKEIIELNKIDNPDKIGAGAKILLPQGAAVVETTTTTTTTAVVAAGTP
jgi:LysM repeat protein